MGGRMMRLEIFRATFAATFAVPCLPGPAGARGMKAELARLGVGVLGGLRGVDQESAPNDATLRSKINGN